MRSPLQFSQDYGTESVFKSATAPLTIGQARVGIGSVGPLDPYSANVVALLHFDGAEGGTTYTDEIGRTYTGFGAAQTVQSEKKFGTASLSIPGAGSYVETANWAGLTIVPAAGYTVEFWANLPSSNGAADCFLDCRTGAGAEGWGIYTDPAGEVFLQGNGGAAVSSSGVFVFGAWKHIAVCVDGTSTRVYYDGAKVAENASVPYGTVTNALRIGGQLNGSYPINGNIDDLRITKGAARYTGNTYTVPSAAFGYP